MVRRYSDGELNVRLGFYGTESMRELLDELAEEKRCSVSSIVREALKRYIEEEKRNG